MNKTAQQIQEKQEKRYRLLHRLYEATEGNPNVSVALSDLAAEAGLSYEEADSALDYLAAESLVSLDGFGPLVSLTHRGIVEIEQSINKPDRPTEHFSNQIIQHFHGPVGAIQNAPHSTANVTQGSLEEEEMFQITVALSKAQMEGHGNVLEFELGSREHQLAERMVERGNLKRVGGLPGHYTLP
jgi:hypothetical protein